MRRSEVLACRGTGGPGGQIWVLLADKQSGDDCQGGGGQKLGRSRRLCSHLPSPEAAQGQEAGPAVSSLLPASVVQSCLLGPERVGTQRAAQLDPGHTAFRRPDSSSSRPGSTQHPALSAAGFWFAEGEGGCGFSHLAEAWHRCCLCLVWLQEGETTRWEHVPSHLRPSSLAPTHTATPASCWDLFSDRRLQLPPLSWGWPFPGPGGLPKPRQWLPGSASTCVA